MLEKQVIGGILSEPVQLDEAMEILEEKHFKKEHLKKIFNQAKKLFEEAGRIDPLIIVENLKDKIKDIDNYIFELIRDAQAYNLVQYSKLLREKYKKEKMQLVLTEANADLREGEKTTEEVVNSLIDKIERIDEDKEAGDVLDIAEIIDEELLRLERIEKGLEEIAIPTNFPNLDKLLNGGLHRQDYMVIAARPSVGKTAFALNLATNIAKNKKVLFFSLEMGKEQLFRRIASYLVRIDGETLNTGNLTKDDYHKLALATDEIAQLKLKIADLSKTNINFIKRIARKEHRKDGIDVIIIDHMQLIEGRKGVSRNELYTEISRDLKLLAKELNIPIIVLSQLSRAAEQRADKRPMLSDLRESGAIEQDADIVMLMYRDDYYNKSEEDDGISLVEINIAKNRNGATGVIHYWFAKQYSKFKEAKK